MLLKKLTEDHYVVVTDEPIKEGDYNVPSDFWDISITSKECLEIVNDKRNGYKKITHSTKPFERTEIDFGHEVYAYISIMPLDLSYIKSLVGEVDIEKKAEEYFEKEMQRDINDPKKVQFNFHWRKHFINSYNQCLEDNKDKRFTEKDLRRAFNMARKHIELGINKVSRAYSYTEDEAISILTQPKDTWEVEFIDGQLKLK